MCPNDAAERYSLRGLAARVISELEAAHEGSDWNPDLFWQQRNAVSYFPVSSYVIDWG